MNPQPRKISVMFSTGLLLVLLTLLLAYLLTALQARLPHSRPLPVIGAVNDFTLTNQFAAAVTLADLRGHVWIADIIFSRCPGPCLKMTRQMKELQDALPAASQARLVTLTTDPDFDVPSVLARYADRFSADTNRWVFLTGTKKAVGEFAASGLKLSAVETAPAKRKSEIDMFDHSTSFVIVDKQARLRGVFETGGEGVDWTVEQQKILAAVKQLEREP